jgi:membrane-bound serine protease (ClpP class)
MFRKAACFILIFLSTVLFPSLPLYSIENNNTEVLLIAVNGVINPVSSQFIVKSIKKAEDMKAEAIIIELDTPGGLDASMRDIVKAIMGSKVPVAVYVSPSGARAASAGAFITLSAHFAAMAPGTNIGAAHPVGVGGKMDKTVSEKAENDAAAYIKSIAEKRGRDVTWAEDAVRKSVSITETEALNVNIIDAVSKDMDSLLSFMNGKTVMTAEGEKTLKTSGVKVLKDRMGLRYKILSMISDPNVAYILMMLGFYGLFFELTNPGAIFPGVIGGICIILAFYSFQTLPINYAGVLLIVVGLILFILEVKVTSYGMLTVGGIISVVLGSLMLFDSPLPFLKVSLSVIIPAAIATALFFVVTFRLAYKAYKRKPVTGSEGLIGMEGSAKTDITAEGGAAIVHGEYWSAYSDGYIAKGSRVVVEEIIGLKVKVKKA